MPALSKHGPRIAVTLLPLLLAVLHAVSDAPIVLRSVTLSRTVPTLADTAAAPVALPSKCGVGSLVAAAGASSVAGAWSSAAGAGNTRGTGAGAAAGRAVVDKGQAALTRPFVRGPDGLKATYAVVVQA